MEYTFQLLRKRLFYFNACLFQNDFGFGGNNGLTDFKDLLGRILVQKKLEECFLLFSFDVNNRVFIL